MGAPLNGPSVSERGTQDLAAYNRWLCLIRLRTAGVVFLLVLAVRWFSGPDLEIFDLACVCGSLLVVSALGLCYAPAALAPQRFFYVQSLADVAAITLGIGFWAHGTAALLLRPLYLLVIVEASFVDAESSLLMASAATLGHEILLAVDGGLSLPTFVSLEAIAPPIFFLFLARVASSHRQRLNAALAAQIEESRQRLVAEARTSAALLDVANALSSTLDTPDLLGRLNSTARNQLGADWSGTFLVDAERSTFRCVAKTNRENAAANGSIEIPMHAWAPLERFANERVILLSGAEGERASALLTGRQSVSTVVVAALHHDRALAGFLAVGCGVLSETERERALSFLAGIARHATIVLQNARLLEQVRLASALKSEFVGAISHELRSPLNVILGYLEMVLDEALGPVTTDQTHALRRTREQSLALLEMITALLDLNRLEGGRLPLQRATVSPEKLLGEICDQLPENWRRPGVQLLRAIVPKLPEIETDPGKLKTIVRNLLHNAFKFTEDGHVTLGAALTPEGILTITVSDTGRGIPREAQQYIFDMFRQVPGAGGGGVGLGLHLVKRLVNVLGGTVAVESKLSEGTCFTITLPRALPAPDAEVGRTAAANDPAAAPRSARVPGRPTPVAHRPADRAADAA